MFIKKFSIIEGHFVWGYIQNFQKILIKPEYFVNIGYKIICS